MISFSRCLKNLFRRRQHNPTTITNSKYFWDGTSLEPAKSETIKTPDRQQDGVYSFGLSNPNNPRQGLKFDAVDPLMEKSNPK